MTVIYRERTEVRLSAGDLRRIEEVAEKAANWAEAVEFDAARGQLQGLWACERETGMSRSTLIILMILRGLETTQEPGNSDRNNNGYGYFRRPVTKKECRLESASLPHRVIPIYQTRPLVGLLTTYSDQLGLTTAEVTRGLIRRGLTKSEKIWVAS